MLPRIGDFFLLGASCQAWDCLSSTIGADLTIIQRIAQPKNSVKLQFPSSAISQFLAETSNPPMTEERKYAILFAATLLSARRIVDVLDSSKPNPAKTSSLIRPSKNGDDFGKDEKMDQRWPAT
jgi:hypothetical protein